MLHRYSVFAFTLLTATLSMAQWQAYNSGLQAVKSITTQGGAIYATNYPNGVSKSVNDGLNWSPVNNGLPNSAGSIFVESLGRNETHLFAGTHSGIYRSSDGGNSWTYANGSLTASSTVYVNKFFHFGNTTFAVFSASISNGGGVYRTVDNGDNWLIGHSGMSANMTIYHLAYTGSVLYAATSTGIYQSTNLGQQWTQLSGVNYAVYAIQWSAGRLMAITTNGYRYSTNNGANWTNSTGTPANPDKGQLISYNGNFYALTNGPEGCLISTNNGASFQAYNTGISAINQVSLEEFHATGTKLYVGALLDLYSIPGSTVGMTATSERSGPFPFPTVFDNGFHVDLASESAGQTIILFDGLGREVMRQGNLPSGLVHIEREAGLASGRYQCVLFDPASGLRRSLGPVIAQ